jgi:thioredoxin-like negative regulator of GroEL
VANNPISSVDDSTFDTEVLKSRIPVAVYFYATWSKQCALVEAWLPNNVVQRYGTKLKVCNNVVSVPTLIVFNGGSGLKSFGPSSPHFDFKGVIAYLDSMVL